MVLSLHIMPAVAYHGGLENSSHNLKIPMFDGGSGYWWILSTTQFWKENRIPESQWLLEVNSGFRGHPLIWFQLWHKRNPTASWMVFEIAFLLRYQPDFSHVLPEIIQNEVFDFEIDREEATHKITNQDLDSLSAHPQEEVLVDDMANDANKGVIELTFASNKAEVRAYCYSITPILENEFFIHCSCTSRFIVEDQFPARVPLSSVTDTINESCSFLQIISQIMILIHTVQQIYCLYNFSDLCIHTLDVCAGIMKFSSEIILVFDPGADGKLWYLIFIYINRCLLEIVIGRKSTANYVAFGHHDGKFDGDATIHGLGKICVENLFSARHFRFTDSIIEVNGAEYCRYMTSDCYYMSCNNHGLDGSGLSQWEASNLQSREARATVISAILTTVCSFVRHFSLNEISKGIDDFLYYFLKEEQSNYKTIQQPHSLIIEMLLSNHQNYKVDEVPVWNFLSNIGFVSSESYNLHFKNNINVLKDHIVMFTWDPGPNIKLSCCMHVSSAFKLFDVGQLYLSFHLGGKEACCEFMLICWDVIDFTPCYCWPGFFTFHDSFIFELVGIFYGEQGKMLTLVHIYCNIMDSMNFDQHFFDKCLLCMEYGNAHESDEILRMKVINQRTTKHHGAIPFHNAGSLTNLCGQSIKRMAKLQFYLTHIFRRYIGPSFVPNEASLLHQNELNMKVYGFTQSLAALVISSGCRTGIYIHKKSMDTIGVGISFGRYDWNMRNFISSVSHSDSDSGKMFVYWKVLKIAYITLAMLVGTKLDLHEEIMPLYSFFHMNMQIDLDKNTLHVLVLMVSIFRNPFLIMKNMYENETRVKLYTMQIEFQHRNEKIYVNMIFQVFSVSRNDFFSASQHPCLWVLVFDPGGE